MSDDGQGPLRSAAQDPTRPSVNNDNGPRQPISLSNINITSSPPPRNRMTSLLQPNAAPVTRSLTTEAVDSELAGSSSTVIPQQGPSAVASLRSAAASFSAVATTRLPPIATARQVLDGEGFGQPEDYLSSAWTSANDALARLNIQASALRSTATSPLSLAPTNAQGATGDDARDAPDVLPILSTIQDLRSALHERVRNLGQEVERLRGRATAMETNFDAIRRDRRSSSTMPLYAQGEVHPPRSNDTLFDHSLALDEDLFPPIFEPKTGSGSKEIEGDKKRRRLIRLKQLEIKSKRLESKTSFEAVQRRARSLNTGDSEYPLEPSSISPDQPWAGRASRQNPLSQTGSRSARAGPSVTATTLSWSDIAGNRGALDRGPTGEETTTAEEGLTLRGLRIRNVMNSIRNRRQQTLEETLRSDRRYRDALMNRPVPPPVITPSIPSSGPPPLAPSVYRQRLDQMTRERLEMRSDSSPPLTSGSNPTVALSNVQGRISSTLSNLDFDRIVGRLRGLLDEASQHQRERSAQGQPSEGFGSQGITSTALRSAEQSVQELQTLHRMLESLRERMDSARATLRQTQSTIADNGRNDGLDTNETTALLHDFSTNGESNLSGLRDDPLLRRSDEIATARLSSSTRQEARDPLLPFRHATVARRPSSPYIRSPTHPHHRSRIDSHPVVTVLNIDNLNSFEIRFDGHIIFRPIAHRQPDRELIARCLAMLPGGRDNVPSRWMRLHGEFGSRRRAESSGGYRVRWISENLDEGSTTRTNLSLHSLPKIIAFDFCVTPGDEDAFVRIDEVEFYTFRTRLRANMGPWVNSRVRIEPFPNDPPVATWGTSAHVRQAIQEVGELLPGDYVRFNLVDRTVTLVRASRRSGPPMLQSGSGSRSELRRTQDLSAYTTEPDPLWLNAYEPAVTQTRQMWAEHVQRWHGRTPADGERRAGFLPVGRIPERFNPVYNSEEVWTRDFLDADGMPLPPINLNTLRSEDAHSPARESSVEALV